MKLDKTEALTLNIISTILLVIYFSLYILLRLVVSGFYDENTPIITKILTTGLFFSIICYPISVFIAWLNFFIKNYSFASLPYYNMFIIFILLLVL
ncbi:hypothetical protein [Oceanivirga salmonicida]|uniref:hypothetical protein n=1 Tax=Oceanivirga salmonicida TaxID=1769291 RepID=UPI00082CFB2D|nr:hypothetical protein [Oceanivirga salmonicida]